MKRADRIDPAQRACDAINAMIGLPTPPPAPQADAVESLILDLQREVYALRQMLSASRPHISPTKVTSPPQSDLFHSGHDESEGEWSELMPKSIIAAAIGSDPRMVVPHLRHTGLIQKSRERWKVCFDGLSQDWADAIWEAQDRFLRRN